MKKVVLAVSVYLVGLSIACGGSIPATRSPVTTSDLESPFPTDTVTPFFPEWTDLPTATPTVSPTVTDTSTPSQTPTLAPDAWQSMPIVPSPSDSARRVYQDGLGFGNDPHAFSILGDCLSLSYNLFGNLGLGPAYYNLGEYTYLQPAVEWFTPSFNRQSISLGNGFTTAAVLSPLFSNPYLCNSGENPMACEYRIHHPSYAIIALGTDDLYTSYATYEARMRQIVEYTLSQGILPILATKADNREGYYMFNRINANLAYEYDVPMWNFWAAVQPLPYQGLIDNRGHLSWADPDNFGTTYSLQRAVPVRTLTALQTLDSVWRGTAGE